MIALSPDQPTEAPPGSSRKIEILRMRAEANLPLFLAEDNRNAPLNESQHSTPIRDEYRVEVIRAAEQAVKARARLKMAQPIPILAATYRNRTRRQIWLKAVKAAGVELMQMVNAKQIEETAVFAIEGLHQLIDEVAIYCSAGQDSLNAVGEKLRIATEAGKEDRAEAMRHLRKAEETAGAISSYRQTLTDLQYEFPEFFHNGKPIKASPMVEVGCA